MKRLFDDLAHRLQSLYKALRYFSNHHRANEDLKRANLLALSMLRGRHKGQRAVIIGNGPSLLIKDLERLGNDITFASNKIFLAYGETKWRPTYYTVEDHLVLKNNFSEIYNLQDSTKLFPSNTRDSGYFAADTIFAPSLQPKSYETPLEDQNFPEFSTDLCRGIGWGSTVVYSQIQMALHMGCREIILIGIDHNYELPTKSDGKVFVGEGEQNHFHPDYRQPGEKWHPPNLDVLEVSYRKARKVCESRGVLIVNASRQTQLEVFQRADFDNIFPR